MANSKPQKIRSSDAEWFSRVLVAYQGRVPFVFIDDAELGIDLERQSLAQIGIKARLVTKDWVAALSSFGVCGFGAYMVVAAILDPEPTSKLGLLVGSGVALMFSGSFSGVRVLTRLKPPSVRISNGLVEVRWDD